MTAVATVLNDRLAGLTLGDIRTLARARACATPAPTEARPSSSTSFSRKASSCSTPRCRCADGHVVLGAASVLAEQPEFSGADRMRRLLALTEKPQALGEAIRKRAQAPGISITIGAEHDDPTSRGFHRRHGGVPRRVLGGSDRRDRPDAHALRQSHFAREPHLAAPERSAGLI